MERKMITFFRIRVDKDGENETESDEETEDVEKMDMTKFSCYKLRIFLISKPNAICVKSIAFKVEI